MKVIYNNRNDEMAKYGGELEVVTTAHLGSALRIHDFIKEYLMRKSTGQERAIKEPRSGASLEVEQEHNLNAIPEVSSQHERTNQHRGSQLGVPSSSGQPVSGSLEQEHEAQEDSSVMPDQDWRNLR